MSKTTVGLLYLINKYGKKHRIRNEVIVHLVDDQLQMIKKDTCGMYQIYFYVNLFNLLDSSSILSKKNLDKKTIEKLLNEILSTDRQENESRIKAFAQENDILQNLVVTKTCSIQQSLFVGNCLTLDRLFTAIEFWRCWTICCVLYLSLCLGSITSFY